jgi:hypothetical protein
MAKILKDAKAIGSLITEIGKTGKKLDKDIQQASVSIIAHVEECGNITLANRLVTNMPKGSRVNAVISHMTLNGKMKFDDKSGKIVYNKNKKTDLQNAQDKPWWTEKPEAPFTPANYDLATYFQKQLDKNNEDAKREGLTTDQKAKILSNVSKIVADAKVMGINLDK